MSDEISKVHSVIADNLAAIHDKIAAAEGAYKMQTRLDRPVTLVAVSKRQPDDRIDAALAAASVCLAKTAFKKPKADGCHVAIDMPI